MSERLSDPSQLKALGSAGTNYVYTGADKSLLESFPNPMPRSEDGATSTSSVVQITAPEFTSLCPLTGQPDFATIVIDYMPREVCVESKSIKLYLGSFRNVGEFHEACVTRIFTDLKELLDPEYLKVEGQFTPRGGIPFWPSIEYYRLT